MARAIDEMALAAKGEGCLGRCHPDEPVFILRAQDLLSGDVVREWADRLQARAVGAGRLDALTKAKIQEARQLALQMDAWQTRKLPD